MSIAGIAKEVTTISVSAWVFHDELTALNLVGVSITICGSSLRSTFLQFVVDASSGIALFTYHKYQKSIQSKEPLPAEHGVPFLDEEYMGVGRGELASGSTTSNSRGSYASDDGEDVRAWSSAFPSIEVTNDDLSYVAQPVSNHVLFTVDDDDGDEEQDGNIGGPSRHPGLRDEEANLNEVEEGIDTDPWTSLEASHELPNR